VFSFWVKDDRNVRFPDRWSNCCPQQQKERNAIHTTFPHAAVQLEDTRSLRWSPFLGYPVDTPPFIAHFLRVEVLARGGALAKDEVPETNPAASA